MLPAERPLPSLSLISVKDVHDVPAGKKNREQYG
jgi:hypothetical protein